MTRRILLDTNIVSHILNGHPAVTRKLVATPMALLCVSAITVGKLRFGLAKRPQSRKLRAAVEEFLQRVDCLPWTDATAATYGKLRAELALKGKPLGPLDLLIAAQALETDATLATNDAAFRKVRGLTIEDWTRDEG